MMSSHLDNQGPTTAKSSGNGKKKTQDKQSAKCVRPPLKQSKILTDRTLIQYVQLRDVSAGGLPYSAAFRHGHQFWKLHGEECLVTIGSSYVAQVSIDNIPELEEATDIGTARTIIMKRLKTEKVLRDQLQQQIASFESDADAPEQFASFNRDNPSTRSKQAQKKFTSSLLIDDKTQEKAELEDSNRRQKDASPTIELRKTVLAQHNDTRSSDSDSSSLPSSDVQDSQKSEKHQPTQKRIPPPRSLKTLKKLTDGTDNQYIKLRFKVKGLPYSAKLQSFGTTWSLLAEQCLVTFGDTYVARVAIDRNDELDAASDFCLARDILINNVKIVQVLYDETKQKIVNCVESIKTELHNLKTKCATDSTSARCLLEMVKIAENCGYKITDEFCDEIVSSSIFQNEKLESTFVEILDKRIELQKRSIFEAADDEDGHDFDEFFENSLKEIFEEHQTRLQEICSPRIKSSLTDFTPHCCMLLREADIRLCG